MEVAAGSSGYAALGLKIPTFLACGALRGGMNSEDDGSDSGIEAISYRVITVDVIELSDSDSGDQQDLDKVKELPVSNPELTMRRKIVSPNSTRIEDFFKSPSKEKSKNEPKLANDRNPRSGLGSRDKQKTIKTVESTKRRSKNEDISTEHGAIDDKMATSTSQRSSKKRSSELPELPVDRRSKSTRTEHDELDLDQLTYTAVQAERMRLMEQERREKHEESIDASKAARQLFTELYCDKRFKRGRRNGQFIVNDASLRTRLQDLAIFRPAPKFDVNCGTQSAWSLKMWPLIFKTKIPYGQLPSIEDPRFEWLQYAMCSEDNDQVRQKYCANWIRIIHKELDDGMNIGELVDVVLRIAQQLGVPSNVLYCETEGELVRCLDPAIGSVRPRQQIIYHSGVEAPHVGIVASVLQVLADLMTDMLMSDWDIQEIKSPAMLVLKLLLFGAVDFQMEPVRSCIRGSLVKLVEPSSRYLSHEVLAIFTMFGTYRFKLRILECVKGTLLHNALAASYLTQTHTGPTSLRAVFDLMPSLSLFDPSRSENRAEDKHKVACLLHLLDDIQHGLSFADFENDYDGMGDLQDLAFRLENTLKSLQVSDPNSLGLMSAVNALNAIVQTADPVSQYELV
uniref:ARAD1A15730p n=1 Tax=Blastobotrys adeninivorans TaxID=409370 RepID=A0A060SYF1_BLAAD